jgi:hypothetical protein
MSKDIIIQKEGVSYELDGVEYLRTKSPDGGLIDWVPEDETNIQTLSVTENGTYVPGSGVYGFGVVTVSIPASSVTGTINGTMVTVTVDENGYLVYTPV